MKKHIEATKTTIENAKALKTDFIDLENQLANAEDTMKEHLNSKSKEINILKIFKNIFFRRNRREGERRIKRK